MSFFGNLLSGIGSAASGLVSLIPGIGPVAGSAISGGVSALSNALGQSSQNSDNLKSQYAIQNSANEFNREMWNANNAYNTPAAQLQRYREAGLNPIFASMGNSTAQQISSGSGGSNVQTVQDYGQRQVMQQQQTANMLDNLKKGAEVSYLLRKEKDKKSDYSFSPFERQLSATTQSVVEQAKSAMHDATLKQYEVQFQTQTFEQRKDMLISNLNKVKEELSLVRSQERLNNKECDHLIKLIDKLGAEIEVCKSQKNLYDKQLERLGQELMSNEAMSKFMSENPTSAVFLTFLGQILGVHVGL